MAKDSKEKIISSNKAIIGVINSAFCIDRGFNINKLSDNETELSRIIKNIKESEDKNIFLTLESLDILLDSNFYDAISNRTIYIEQQEKPYSKDDNSDISLKGDIGSFIVRKAINYIKIRRTIPYDRKIYITTNEDVLISRFLNKYKDIPLIQVVDGEDGKETFILKVPHHIVDKYVKKSSYRDGLSIEKMLLNIKDSKINDGEKVYTIEIKFVKTNSIFNRILEEYFNNGVDGDIVEMFKKGVEEFIKNYPGKLSDKNKIILTDQIEKEIRLNVKNIKAYLSSYSDKKETQAIIFMITGAIIFKLSIFAMGIAAIGTGGIGAVFIIGFLNAHLSVYYSFASAILGLNSLAEEQAELNELSKDLFFVSLLQNFGNAILPFKNYEYKLRGNYMYGGNFIDVYNSCSYNNMLAKYYIHCNYDLINNNANDKIILNIKNLEKNYLKMYDKLKPEYQKGIADNKFHINLYASPFYYLNEEYNNTLMSCFLSSSFFKYNFSLQKFHERYMELLTESKEIMFKTAVKSTTSLMYVETPYYSTNLLNDYLVEAQNEKNDYKRILSPRSIVFLTNPLISGESSVIKNELKDKFNIDISYMSYGKGADDVRRGYGIEDYQFYDILVDNRKQEETSMYMMYFSAFKYSSLISIIEKFKNIMNDLEKFLESIGLDYNSFLALFSNYKDKIKLDNIQNKYSTIFYIKESLENYIVALNAIEVDSTKLWSHEEHFATKLYFLAKIEDHINVLSSFYNRFLSLKEELLYFHSNKTLEDYEKMKELEKNFLIRTIKQFITVKKVHLFKLLECNFGSELRGGLDINYKNVNEAFLLCLNIAKYGFYEGMDVLVYNFIKKRSLDTAYNLGKRNFDNFIEKIRNRYIANSKHFVYINHIISIFKFSILFCYGIDEEIIDIMKVRYKKYSVENILDRIFFITCYKNHGQIIHEDNGRPFFSNQFLAAEFYHIINKLIEEIDIKKAEKNTDYKNHGQIIHEGNGRPFFSNQFLVAKFYHIINKLMEEIDIKKAEKNTDGNKEEKIDSVFNNVAINLEKEILIEVRDTISSMYKKSTSKEYTLYVEMFITSFVGKENLNGNIGVNINKGGFQSHSAMSPSNWFHSLLFSSTDIYSGIKGIFIGKFSFGGLGLFFTNIVAAYVSTELLNIPDSEKLKEYIELYNFLYIDNKKLPANTVINGNVICRPINISNNMALFDKKTLLFGDSNMGINSFHNSHSLYANINDNGMGSSMFKDRMKTLLTGCDVNGLDNILLKKYKDNYCNQENKEICGAGAYKAWEYIRNKHKEYIDNNKEKELNIDLKTIKSMLGIVDEVSNEEQENNNATNNENLNNQEIEDKGKQNEYKVNSNNVRKKSYKKTNIEFPATIVAKSFYNAVCYVEDYEPNIELVPKKKAEVEHLKDNEGKRNLTFVESLYEIAKQNLYSAYTNESNKNDKYVLEKELIIHNQQSFIGIISLWVLPQGLKEGK